MRLTKDLQLAGIAEVALSYYPWGSKQGSPEPKVWHHDLLRSDGTPYDSQETALIRQLTGHDR